MGKLTGFRKSLLGTVMVAGLLGATGANAQMATYYDNNVVVDLSVLDQGGSPRATPSISNPYTQPKMPPVKMPRSTFYGLPEGVQPVIVEEAQSTLDIPQGQPKSRLLVQRPASSSTTTAPKLKLPSQTVELVKPAEPQKPVVRDVEVAKSEPKPMIKATPKVDVVAPPAPVAPKPEVVEKPSLPTQVVAEAPKPVAAPSLPVKVEKTEPAMPKVMEPKETAAPAAVMAEAPPPPPPSVIEPKEVESAIKADTSPSPTKTASLPTSSEANVRISFQSGQSKLPVSAESNLQKLASDLNQHPDDRVQLLAYAGGEDLSASKARRLSLSRALAVRSYLIAQGIRSTRIDVRALGNKTTEEPFDRVDVQIAPR